MHDGHSNDIDFTGTANELPADARCLAEDEFTHVEPLARPWWARRNDDA